MVVPSAKLMVPRPGCVVLAYRQEPSTLRTSLCSSTGAFETTWPFSVPLHAPVASVVTRRRCWLLVAGGEKLTVASNEQVPAKLWSRPVAPAGVSPAPISATVTPTESQITRRPLAPFPSLLLPFIPSLPSARSAATPRPRARPRSPRSGPASPRRAGPGHRDPSGRKVVPESAPRRSEPRARASSAVSPHPRLDGSLRFSGFQRGAP